MFNDRGSKYWPHEKMINDIPDDVLLMILDEELLFRSVCKEWNRLIPYNGLTEAFFDSFLIKKTKTSERIFLKDYKTKWFSQYPGHNYAFSSPFVHRPKRDCCLAFTKKGTMCKNKVLNPPYLCRAHMKLVPGLCDRNVS